MLFARCAKSSLRDAQGATDFREMQRAVGVGCQEVSEARDDLRVASFTIPQTIPSTLLERRPDIAGMERRMAEANRVIGIARAAFFPNVSFRLGGGYEGGSFDLIKLANSFWSYGAAVSMPIFQGGYRRAQLQQSWSAYRETEDLYRSTVLNAFGRSRTI